MNVYISRLVAAMVTGIVTWLANKFVFFQFLLEPENVEAAAALTVSLALAVYSLVHKKLSKTTNPQDTAVTSTPPRKL